MIPLIQAGREGGRSDWLGFAGAIIGSSFTSIVAGAAIYFASRSIRQQITAALLSREEDRIERDLPGLRDARNYLNCFVATFSPVTAFFEIGPELNRLGIGLPNSTLTQDVKRLLPGTHDATLIQVQRFLGNAQSAALAAQNARHSFQHFENNIGDPAHWDPAALAAHRTEIANIRRAFDQHRADFRNELEAILAYIDGTRFEDRVVRTPPHPDTPRTQRVFRQRMKVKSSTGEIRDMGVRRILIDRTD